MHSHCVRALLSPTIGLVSFTARQLLSPQVSTQDRCPQGQLGTWPLSDQSTFWILMLAPCPVSGFNMYFIFSELSRGPLGHCGGDPRFPSAHFWLFLLAGKAAQSPLGACFQVVPQSPAHPPTSGVPCQTHVHPDLQMRNLRPRLQCGHSKLCVADTWNQVLTLPQHSCDTLDVFLNLSETDIAKRGSSRGIRVDGEELEVNSAGPA